MSNTTPATKMTVREILASTANVNEYYEFSDYHAARSSLKRRMDMQIPKLKFLQKENLIDTDTTYLTFTNIAPETGGTYDDTVIHRLHDDSIVGKFCFQTWGHEKHGTAFYVINDEKFDFHDWKTMKAELKDNEELRELIRKQFNPDYVEPEIEPEVKKEKPAKSKIKVEDVIDEELDDLDAHIPAKRKRRKAKAKPESEVIESTEAEIVENVEIEEQPEIEPEVEIVE